MRKLAYMNSFDELDSVSSRSSAIRTGYFHYFPHLMASVPSECGALRFHFGVVLSGFAKVAQWQEAEDLLKLMQRRLPSTCLDHF